MTGRGQKEVKHISGGCNLEMLADKAKVTINDEYEVMGSLSNGAIGLDLT